MVKVYSGSKKKYGEFLTNIRGFLEKIGGLLYQKLWFCDDGFFIGKKNTTSLLQTVDFLLKGLMGTSWIIIVDVSKKIVDFWRQIIGEP